MLVISFVCLSVALALPVSAAADSPDPITTDEAGAGRTVVSNGGFAAVETDPVLVGAGVLVLVLFAGGMVSVWRRRRPVMDQEPLDRVPIGT